MVFVNQREDYRITDVLRKISGQNTLLISEGYPFQTSMINFVVVEGHPRFEVNEELMTGEGLYVDDLFLAQGYVHAQDRLWQMEFQRRLVAGLSDSGDTS